MERIVREDKNGRQRFTDIRVEDLGNGTADIVKVTGTHRWKDDRVSNERQDGL
jgi:hypothetical protein